MKIPIRLRTLPRIPRRNCEGSTRWYLVIPSGGDNEAGQSLVLIALLMIGMVGMLGLVLDGGQVFAARRQSQNAADAGALASVRLLAASRDSVTQTDLWNAVTDLTNSNGVPLTDVVASLIDASSHDICTLNQNCPESPIPDAATGVRVTTTLQMDPYFMDILIGDAQVPVVAMAAVQSGPARIAKNVMPMVVPCDQLLLSGDCPYTLDEVVEIFGASTGSGSNQWADLGPDALESYIRLHSRGGDIMADPPLGTPPDVTYECPTPDSCPPPNPWIKTKTGEDQGIRDALDCWINPNGSHCWLNNNQYPAAYPGDRKWIVPIIDFKDYDSGNNLEYHTEKFGEFDFLGYWSANNQCNWVGKGSEECGCTNNPAVIVDHPTLACPANKVPIISELEPCLVSGEKCLMGKFVREVKDLAIRRGPCNIGIDFCGIGMSQ